MRPAIKKRLVAAMRSGKYGWTKGALCVVNGVDRFCAAGILGDLYVESHPNAWWEPRHKSEALKGNALMIRDEDAERKWLGRGHVYPHEPFPLGDELGLPEFVCEWAGLTEQQAHNLMRFNDRNDTVSLDQVADFVEREL